jgi:Zn-dependent M28 family amino/carboxypeptidase
MLLWGGLGLAIILGIGSAYYVMCSMPGRSYAGAFQPLRADEITLRDSLRQHVYILAGDIGERQLWRPAALERATQYIEATWQAQGYHVTRQSVMPEVKTVYNLETEISGGLRRDDIVVVGGHYDTVLGSPGANDNATGTAAVLELARLLAAQRLARTVRFVAFVNEEVPFFQTGTMGSWVYARRSRARGEQIVAMLSIETIGFYSDVVGSQHYPFPFGLFYPRTGNFIGFVGNIASRALVRRSLAAFRQHAPFPSEGVAAPGWMTGIGWSDHWAFWQEGYPGVMVTDTALFRYAPYHTREDTPDRVNYDHMARVVAGLARVVTTLADAPRL